MTKSLLQLTQNILSAMDSDEVNSIYDTVEALQVATIVVETLEAEFNNIDLPSFQRILKLDSVSDLSRPNYLRYSSDTNQIAWMRYRDNRAQGRYKSLTYLTPGDFFNRLVMVTSNGANRQKIEDPTGVSYWIQNDRAPTFFTSVDNEHLIFDSYDKAFEDTLQEANTFTIGSTNLTDSSLSDDFIPAIPSELFPLLLAEAKSSCFMTLKQMPHPKSEQIARRQRSRMQSNRYKTAKADYPYVRSKYNFARNR